MSHNPYYTRPGVMERAPHLVHLCLRDTPEVTGYQVWGSRSVDGAYGAAPGSGVSGAPVAMFTVPKGGGYRSASLRRSGRGQIHGSTKGQTHMAFDPDDYLGVGIDLPPDEHWLFLRVQEARPVPGLLALAGVPEATITLSGVMAGDRLTIKGVVFEFTAGANNLAGKAGTGGDPFLVGLGASDVDAAANLTLALNDGGDVIPAMDAVALVGAHTLATNVAAPSAVVLVQPASMPLLAGDTVKFGITSSDLAHIALDAASAAAGTLVWVPDVTNPVLGPTFCVPPARYFGTSQPTFTLQGTAPSATDSAFGVAPNLSEDLGRVSPRAMYLVFPSILSEVAIHNISGDDMLVSFGAGQPMQTVAAGGELSLTSGNATIREVLVASLGGAGSVFTLHAAAATE